MKLRGLIALLLAGCGGDNVLHTCDIRDSDCQRDVFLAVQDVRGSLWDPWLEPPAMRVISEAAYRDELIAAHDRAVREGGVDYLTAALKLLHMLDPAEEPDAAASFDVSKHIAYYDVPSKTVTIIDHGEVVSPRSAVQTLAHELVHAAQDRDIGYERLYREAASTDNSNALTSLLEGEARVYELLVDAKQEGWPKGRVDWAMLFNNATLDQRNEAFTQLAPRSPYRVATSQLGYSLGGFYLSQAYTSGGPLEIRRIFDHPPLSAARFMAGLGTVGDREAPGWHCYAPAEPPGFQLLRADELGAYGVYAFATLTTVIEDEAWERAKLWMGDRFYIYTDPRDANALVVVWRLRFQQPVTAAILQASLAATPWAADIETALQGDTLHVIASSRPLDPSYEDWRQCVPLPPLE